MKEVNYCERRGDSLAIIKLLTPENAEDYVSLYNMERLQTVMQNDIGKAQSQILRDYEYYTSMRNDF